MPIHSYRQTRKDAALKPICPNTFTNKPGKMRSRTYLPIHLPTTPEICSLEPTCPYTLTDKPGKMRSRTYLPIHLPTTPERCSLESTCPYTLTDKPGKMQPRTLPAHILLPTNPERCGLKTYMLIHSYRQTRKDAALKPTCPNNLTNKPGKMRVSNLPAHTLTDNPGKMQPRTYLPIHSYRQTRKDAASNLPAHTLLSTNPERCSLEPTCPYTLTDKPGKMLWFLFDVCFTALRHILCHFGRGLLT